MERQREVIKEAKIVTDREKRQKMRKAFPPPFPPLRAWTSVWPWTTGRHRGYQAPCTRAHPTMAAGAQTHTGFPPNSFQGYKGGREQNSYGPLLPPFPHFYADVSAPYSFSVCLPCSASLLPFPFQPSQDINSAELCHLSFFWHLLSWKERLHLSPLPPLRSPGPASLS